MVSIEDPGSPDLNVFDSNGYLADMDLLAAMTDLLEKEHFL